MVRYDRKASHTAFIPEIENLHGNQKAGPKGPAPLLIPVNRSRSSCALIRLKGSRWSAPSDIQILGERRTLLDEAETRLRLRAHEIVHRLGNLAAVAVTDFDAQKGAPLRIHGGFLELSGIHLTEALEAADLDLAAAIEDGLQQLLLVLLVTRIGRLRALRDLVERWHSQEEMTVVDELRHLLVEERDQQRRDMRAVDVGVGHDDDALVAQVLVPVLGARTDAERQYEVRKELVLRELGR